MRRLFMIVLMVVMGCANGCAWSGRGYYASAPLGFLPLTAAPVVQVAPVVPYHFTPSAPRFRVR